MKRHFTHNYLLSPRHRISVALIGAGGTGSQILPELARIDHALYVLVHPGLHVTVYDDDIVTEANIGRQLFSHSDIGLSKSVVLVDRINSFYGLDWQSKRERYTKGCDIFNITLTCVDNVSSRIEIGSMLRDHGNGKGDEYLPYYWLDFGNQTDRGQIVLGSIGKIGQPKSSDIAVDSMKCVDELFDLTSVDETESGPSCSLAEALAKQDLFINSMVAQVGGNLLWKLISEGGVDYQGAYVNLKSMNINPIKL